MADKTVDTVLQVYDKTTGIVVRCFRGVTASELLASRYPGMQVYQAPKAPQSLTPATAIFCDSWKVTDQDGVVEAWLIEVPRV